MIRLRAMAFLAIACAVTQPAVAQSSAEGKT